MQTPLHLRVRPIRAMEQAKDDSEELRAGLDAGSTTAKLVIIDSQGNLRYNAYRRHESNLAKTVSAILDDAAQQLLDLPVRLTVTGSAGMGISEVTGIGFVQEVNAAIDFVQQRYPEVSTLIDIGGEDSKMVFFAPQRPPDIRMNGRCAGGTGAFIDQMAELLGISLAQMDLYARHSRRIYPIASRCAVFAKTDVQNLLSRKVDLPEICASIFHAVALQNLATLAHGIDLRPRILLCGGPLSFLPSLRQMFCKTAHLAESDLFLPEYSQYLPAWGAALANKMAAPAHTLRTWRAKVCCRDAGNAAIYSQRRLPALFADEPAYRVWETHRKVGDISSALPQTAAMPLYLGIDSGSTTTKLLALDSEERMVFHTYLPNRGKPVEAVATAAEELRAAFAARARTELGGVVVTGYGEDLIRAAFNLPAGVVETVAHWRGAVHFDPEVSFILDIGGQDMKAIFIDRGSIQRIEINEACSSGCGSFIENFAKTLGLSAEEFSALACRSRAPCDLGTRCTVFMNSCIKQAQRESATIEDIAAGLAYSVVKNALYKVLKLSSARQMGEHIVVQGGTFRNLAIVRALELAIGHSVSASRWPELMGAYGAALLAKEGTVHP